MKHQITVLLGCAMLLGACNKENVVETPTAPVAMSYKIQPAKIGELRHFAEMKKAGTSFRLSEESFSEEEFWLYTESVVNSLVTEFELKPDMTQERAISYAFTGDEFSNVNLVETIFEIQNLILVDLENVQFDVDGTPFVHLVDVEWTPNNSNPTIFYIAGVVNGIPPVNTNPNFQMTFLPSSCDSFALNGRMQRMMLSHWASQPNIANRFRPNYLFSPPMWQQNYIPCYTYTEVSSRTVRYDDPNDRVHYLVQGPSTIKLWHSTVFGVNTVPVCVPDVVNNILRNLLSVARGTAETGISLNPNPYNFNNNINGLVLIGFSITPRFAKSTDILIPNAQGNQYEHWHNVVYSYGRQIPCDAANE